MNFKNRLIAALIFYILSSNFNFEVKAQNPDVYKKISRIESYSKYEVIVVDTLSLKHLSDSSITFLELISYIRKGNKDLSGKAEEKSKSGSVERHRTYYFDEQGKIFALIERIQPPGEPLKKLTYFYEVGDLKLVVDENNQDVTNSVDKEKMYYWIRRMFDEYVLK
ncbi:MAG: hypothetical protein ACK5WF_00415 [Cyclobacteriaceae bacterium]